MTKAEDFANRTLTWWLKQLSLHQIWGLLGALFVLVAGGSSVGFWLGSISQQSAKTANAVPIAATQPPARSEVLPADITSFDLGLLRVLAEPHRCAVMKEHLAYRLDASLLQIETVLEKLEKKGLVYTVRTEGGDTLDAILSQAGLQFMNEHQLFTKKKLDHDAA